MSRIIKLLYIRMLKDGFTFERMIDHGDNSYTIYLLKSHPDDHFICKIVPRDRSVFK